MFIVNITFLSHGITIFVVVDLLFFFLVVWYLEIFEWDVYLAVYFKDYERRESEGWKVYLSA